MLQSGTQEPQAPFKSVTSLVVHFNSTNGITTGDNDMLMNNTIGSDQRTNKDMPEQVRLATRKQTSPDSGYIHRRRTCPIATSLDAPFTLWSAFRELATS